MNKKKFDCVEMMRNIRTNHRMKYEKNPALRKKRLDEIHKKFGFAIREELQPNSEAPSVVEQWGSACRNVRQNL